jgi:hypothetical protein
MSDASRESELQQAKHDLSIARQQIRHLEQQNQALAVLPTEVVNAADRR